VVVAVENTEPKVRKPPQHAPAPDVRPGATLAVASIATALVLIVFTVPLTTLTSTARALAAGPGAQAWILSAMSVGAAAGLLGSGAIGDDYGRRRTFLGGTLLLALASAGGALAPNAFLLIVARIVQGVGGAAILACGLGLIGQVYPGRALARATGIWAAALGAGVASGPILASALAGSSAVFSAARQVSLPCTAFTPTVRSFGFCRGCSWQEQPTGCSMRRWGGKR
jgi:MFS family permease